MKKVLTLAGLALLGVVEILVCWNGRLYEAGRGAADPAGRVRLLGRAARLYPWNDRVYFELGKAFFAQGSEALGNPGLRDQAFDASARNLITALRLNPGSAEAHLYLAQALQYLTYLSLPTPVPYFEEYEKAAALTGHASGIYYEVGQVLLGSWESLRPEEKNLALEILKKLLAGKDTEKFRGLLEVWYLHGHDPSVIDRIMPDDAGLERAYALFLGEKSLSLAAREKALARAEFLDFVEAKSELSLGQRGYEYFQSEEAVGHLVSCRRLLGSIRFYQTLAGEKLIDPGEYTQVLKETYLLLAKAQIDKARSLDDSDGYLANYLALEDDPLAVGAFDKFLRERGLLGTAEGTPSRPKDLQALALELRLDFKQNRYRDIARAGEALEGSAFLIPEGGRSRYLAILELVGDSFMKLDDLYEAEKYYLKALSGDPGNLDTLLRLEDCYERLNADAKRIDVRRTIDRLLTPREIALRDRELSSRSPIEVAFVSDGRAVSLTVRLSAAPAAIRPLFSVFFNGRVVWEGFAEAKTLSFSVDPRPGANRLVFETVSGSLSLAGLGWSPRPGD
jgi:tetratricopeptide (TPR) repeat protein